MSATLERPASILGPYARTVAFDADGSLRYVMDDLVEDYFMVLPRIMLLRRSHMDRYAELPEKLHDFIDSEPAHSDDFLLGLANPSSYRVVPPRGSVLDFDAICRGSMQKQSWG